MDVRLVAYRRATTASDTYDVTEFELDLQKNPNVVINYNWLDLKNPESRKTSFSQTLKLPFSDRNNKFFENFFDVNLDTLVYNTKTKFDAIIFIDSVPQLKGFIEMKAIYLNARLYEVALFGDTANFFTDIKDNKLKDAFRTQDTTNPNLYIEDSQLDHKLTLANIVNSWTTGLTTIGGSTDNDIMYPIIDYGHTKNPYSSAMFWNPSDIWVLNELNGDIQNAVNEYGMVRGSDLKPSIRIQRLFHIIAQKAGYQIKSSFMGIDDTAGTPITDTQWFSRLFMTLSTEHTRVQALFNTSTGSEAPFIGFKAELTSSFSNTIIIQTAVDPFSPAGWDIEDSILEELNINNEIYDPNGLFTNDMANWGVSIPPAFSGYDLPSIRIPQDAGDDASLLPSGSMEVKTTIEMNIPATSIEGTDITTITTSVQWYNQATNEPVSDNFEGFVTPGSNQTIEYIEDIPCTAGAVYYLIVKFTSVLSPSAQSVNITINSCTIETLQTDNVALMGGGLNGEVQMYHNMPDITQADFVKDLINRFNLIISTDPDNERLLLIEPYQDYIGDGSTKYWTDKLDVSKEQVVKTTNSYQYKHLKFTDLESDDILNQRYLKAHNTIYGEYNEFRKNDFAGEEFQNFSVMSPFIAQGIGEWQNGGIGGAFPSQDIALAYIFKAAENETREPIDKIKPKLFYYSGTPVDVTGSNNNTGNAYSFHILSSQYTQTYDAYDTSNKFPLCLQYNLDSLGAISSTTKILNWTYYSPAFNSGFTFDFFGGVYSIHGYYNDYWSQYINELYSDESRIMECYLNLNPEDIRSFTEKGFQDSYYIKNTLWRVISIDNYLVGGNKSTKVTLLKVIDKLTTDCGAIPTITNTGLMTWIDAGTGASTTITNTCCEEVNPDWTFVQTNASTGVGDCYASDTTTIFTFDNTNPGVQVPMPSMLPNLETNFNIQSTTGNGNAKTFYIQAITQDSSTAINFSINGIKSQITSLPMYTMNYVKIGIMGSIVSGTNSSKVGYFEYDTMLVRGGRNAYVGTAGGTLLKSNKDSAFTTPTLNLTNYDSRGFWSPTITGGATEVTNWIAKVDIIEQRIGYYNGTFAPPSRALYQNNTGILFQNLNNLEWN